MLKEKYQRAVEIAEELGKINIMSMSGEELKEMIEVLEEEGFNCYVDKSDDYLITEKEEKEINIDYCPECTVAHCQGRYTTGQCE